MKEFTEYIIEVVGENEVQCYVSKNEDEWLTPHYEDAATYAYYEDAESIVNIHTEDFKQELEWDGLVLKEIRIYSKTIKLTEVIKED